MPFLPEFEIKCYNANDENLSIWHRHWGFSNLSSHSNPSLFVSFSTSPFLTWLTPSNHAFYINNCCWVWTSNQQACWTGSPLCAIFYAACPAGRNHAVEHGPTAANPTIPAWWGTAWLHHSKFNSNDQLWSAQLVQMVRVLISSITSQEDQFTI